MFVMAKELSCIMLLACSQRLSRSTTPKIGRRRERKLSFPIQIASQYEVEMWAKSFTSLMQSKAGRASFKSFLESQYCDENILFYEDVHNLHSMMDDEGAVFKKCKEIYSKYISVSSATEISISATIRDKISEKMINPKRDIFNEALAHIYELLYTDVYPRFKISLIYQQALSRAQSERPSPS